MQALVSSGTEQTGRNAHGVARQESAAVAVLYRRLPLGLLDAVQAEAADRQSVPIASVSLIQPQ